MIVIDKELLQEDGTPSIKLLTKCIEQHNNLKEKYKKLNDYYDGEHAIKERTVSNSSLPNNKLVCNHAEYITDMAVGYVFGCPINYSSNNKVVKEESNNTIKNKIKSMLNKSIKSATISPIDELNGIFTEIDEDSHNNELALDISINGLGYELVYMNTEEVPYPELAVLDPRETFLVVDNTVKHRPLFAVHYYPKNDIDGKIKSYYVEVYLTDKKMIYQFKDLTSSTTIGEPEDEPYYFGDIPVIEYKNNKKCKGDFEGVINLIDAYNLLQSDRVNDKEQLVDALLAVMGASFGDDEKEMTETAQLLKSMKILELPEGGDAKWLVKNLNETEIEVLKKSIKDDIHEFSKVPCLTDENFVGNASGVAMKYKLLGFEQLGRTKERYFKKGLRQRFKLISNIENIRAKNIDPSTIDIVMKRSLPVDDELQARIAQETEGFISWETRVSRFDAELDIDKERALLEEENKKKIEQQQAAFSNYNNPLNKDSDVDDEEAE